MEMVMSTSNSAAVPTFGAVALDCPDPLALAGFYREVLGWAAEPDSNEDGEWVTLTNPLGGAKLAFQRVEGYRAPAWPSQENPQQAHERVLSIGGKLLDDKPKTFRVYADPVGHPFCLCAC
jgi:predicted enzyme related to lactoylglutathione lyase